MDIVVRKYGGSSLADPEQVRRVAEGVAAAHRAGQSMVVVVSARGGTTDELTALARSIGQTPQPRETDQLLATGECASAALLAMALNRLDVSAVSLTGAQAGILTSGKHGEGAVTGVNPDRIRELLEAGNVAVVAGFQGINQAGDVVTLGRGGSDITAVALASTLRAEGCEIYTDVNGVYTADPRAVPTARVLSRVDAGMMAEMAFAGVKVLHPRAVELAAMHGVELYVGNSRHARPDASSTGTVIPEGPDRRMLETSGVAVATTHDLDVARVLVHSRGSPNDPAADMLAALSRRCIPVDLVARSGPHEEEFRMGFTVRHSDLSEAQPVLNRAAAALGGGVEVTEDTAKLSLIGMGLLNRPTYTAHMLSTLAAAGIPTSWVSTSQLRTSVTVPRDRVLHGVELLHQEFDLGRNEPDVGTMAPA